MSWNVRGLGDDSKCNVVRNTIREARCDVIGLQETKINERDLNYVSRALPSFFDKQIVSLAAQGSRGGCAIAWKRNYELQNCWTTRHTASAVLKQVQSGQTFVFTNVYGPSTTDGEKMAFIEELRSLRSLIAHPWILLGDFNLVRWYTDRSASFRGYNLMCAFNDLIRDLELSDIDLQNRLYTRSNNRPEQTFSKIDRVFLTNQWMLACPSIKLKALEVAVSDHVPLVLNCSGIGTRPAPFK